MPPNTQNMAQFSSIPFDPSDPALFNFDIASLNFGNQFGALEYSMLNNMSSGATGENQQDLLNQMNQMQTYPQNYHPDSSIMFNQDALINADWSNNHPRANSTAGLLTTPNNTPVVSSIDRQDGANAFPNAYAIGAGPGSMTSASPAASTGLPESLPIDNPQSPALFLSSSQAPSSPAMRRHQSSKGQPVQPVSGDLYASQPQTVNPRKRTYDADLIYETVDKPYGYTNGFHRLFNFIARRFSSEKRLRIAKAVSAIRPSLITFSQSLTEKDLVFMEVSVLMAHRPSLQEETVQSS